MTQERKNPFADLEPEALPVGEGSHIAPPTRFDRVSQELGFSRPSMPEVAVKRQRGTARTVHQFTMRVEVQASNRFVMWCEKHRLNYREAFNMLVDQLDRIDPTRGK